MNAIVNPGQFNDAQQVYDAQQNLSFAIQQASEVKKKVYRKQYPDITYQEDVPIDTSTSMFAKTVTYFSVDGYGKAQWYNGSANDIPYSSTNQTKFEIEIADGAMGYEWDFFDLGQARMVGYNLKEESAFYARRAYEEFAQEIAYRGNADKGFYGLYNDPGVSAGVAVAGATTGNVPFVSKDVDEIMADINNLIIGTYIDTKTIEMIDTIHLPILQMSFLSSRRIAGEGGMTILDFLRTKNVYTIQTGRPLNIRGSRHLAGAGAAGTDRMVGYRKDPEVLSMHIPMPFQFLAPQLKDLSVRVPGVFRIGGVDIRRKGAVRYLDGI